MVIDQQTKSNIGTAVGSAVLNQTDQVTPYGNLKYTQNPNYYFDPNTGHNIPQFTATTTLSPDQQKLHDTQTRVTQGAYDLADQYTGRIGEATAQPFNYEGLPGAPTYNEDYRKQQLDAITQRNQPQMDRDRAAYTQRLADQGIGIEDPAYRTAWDQFDRGVNDFRLGADVQAGNAAAQAYGLEANTRDRAIAERSNLRTQPINETAALLGTGQGVQGPQFVNTPQTQVQPTDVTGVYNNQYAGQMAQWQNQQRQNSAGMGGLFGLAGTLGGAALGSPWAGRAFGFG